MAMNPMDAFNVGQKVGKAKRSTFGQTSDNLMDAFKTSQSTKGAILPVLLKEQLERTRPQSEKENAMTDYYKSGAELNRNIGGNQNSGTNNLDSIASQSGFDKEDYIQNPTVTRYKGQVQVQNTPQLKPPLDSKATAEIGAFRRTRQNLNNNLGMMTPGVKQRMNPLSYGASRLPGSNLLIKGESMMGDSSARDFMTFKAETDKVFQQFRKETTGAQASLKELGWLEPDYPMPNDPPDVYTAKAKEAMKRLEEGEKLLLDTYSQRGFRVGELKKGSSNPFQANRADTAPDASTTSPETDDEESMFQKLKARYGTR